VVWWGGGIGRGVAVVPTFHSLPPSPLSHTHHLPSSTRARQAHTCANRIQTPERRRTVHTQDQVVARHFPYHPFVGVWFACQLHPVPCMCVSVPSCEKIVCRVLCLLSSSLIYNRILLIPHVSPSFLQVISQILSFLYSLTSLASRFTPSPRLHMPRSTASPPPPPPHPPPPPWGGGGCVFF
jgi:hypothetical protein